MVDVDRIERLPVPGHHLVVLLVEQIERRFEELHKAGAPPTTSGGDRRWPNERRVVNVGLAIADRFDEDVVSPVIAEVVDVEEALDTMLDNAR